MRKSLVLLIFVLVLFVGACGGDDTGDTGSSFPNEHYGFNWSNASSDKMIWSDAVEYCEDLGGHLPTISELRTLIQNCPGTETGGGCRVTDSCRSWEYCWDDVCNGCSGAPDGRYSKFGDVGDLWSSSTPSDFGDQAWGVVFSRGMVYPNTSYAYYHVRCVQ